ncbi:transglycosylase SLT domain-containing protein [Merismopedia glauca]|uniref:Tail length tape measure protein n=1 Tax=Merismopedia glauca CCAP 1448/3 TaxID=1296344 RepID=A0A2T1C227_9CYAN|nr:transglycosylase SLT domain-containing protein [Merismopedia glauca]PSB02292.1 tail length tape measure protein [Merismopedia glauca CCAP 1448/3]
MKKTPLFSTPARKLPPKTAKYIIPFSLGVGGIILGTWFATASGWLPWLENPFATESQQKSVDTVLELASVPSPQRRKLLQSMAQSSNIPEQSRARYLLASDLIRDKQAQPALKQLEGLEPKYPVLAPYIALKQAQAYTLAGDRSSATTIWQKIRQSYPKSPVVVEALYALGKEQPQLWDEALAKFPSHPRSLEIAKRRLQENSDRPELIMLLVKYAPDTPGITTYLKSLIDKSASKLKADDLAAIGAIFWQNQLYPQAIAAYSEAPDTPRRAYRLGRSRELNDRKTGAIAAYRYLIGKFPATEEAQLGLQKVLPLLEPNAALSYLDEVVAKHPEIAAQALLEKAKILDNSQKPELATQSRQQILQKYNTSEAAAEYRWIIARKQASGGDLLGAWEQARAIASQNPQSKYAPRAVFWSGKWANQLGKSTEAKTAFEEAIRQYPQSYYAWRSAVNLGWDVGDFQTVRQLSSQLVVSPVKSVLPSGSPALKELYQLGENRDTGTLWQAEFTNRANPTVKEQFTDGLVRLGTGKYLSGIDLVAKLENRKTTQEIAEFNQIKPQFAYWNALYPLPYWDTIEERSQQNQLNPLLTISVMRQESRFESDIKSVAGALGLMQLIPSTAAQEAKSLNLSNYNLQKPEDNILLGTTYLAKMHELHSNNSMLAVASYNAGPGNVAKWLQEKRDLDSDIFVEEIPFSETQWYVKNVFGNYWNYLRLYNPQVSQQVASLINQP